ncbi:MAG: hypothetical protein CMC79_05930 [Flavobacteriaceae bacterium]|nr:hypothetical protein [Flavobacteriaceae bacterium]
MEYIYILRPWQWVKNLLILVPIILTKPLSLDNLQNNLIIFISFSLLASGNYILNDIKDLQNDKLHPKKKFRPIASGKIDINNAKIYSFLVISSSLALTYLVESKLIIYYFFYLLFAYFYTNYFKYIFLINSFSISTFFLIRLLIGGAVSNIKISIYLAMYIFFTSFFIATLKKNAILNTQGIKKSEYLALLKKENLTISTDSLSVISLLLSNVTLIIWSLNNLTEMTETKFAIMIVFLVFYFLFTLLLHTNSKKGELEDFVLGIIQDRNLVLLLIVLLVSFYYVYFN